MAETSLQQNRDLGFHVGLVKMLVTSFHFANAILHNFFMLIFL